MKKYEKNVGKNHFGIVLWIVYKKPIEHMCDLTMHLSAKLKLDLLTANASKLTGITRIQGLSSSSRKAYKTMKGSIIYG